MYTTTRRTFARAFALIAAILFAVTTFSAAPAGAPAAHEAAASTAATTAAPAATRQARAVALGARVVSIAASRRGSPYAYGASGPHRFDCSGLTMWTFRHLHLRLPHSAAAQYAEVRHIKASDRRPGDLVFFHEGGRIYHVGIYAGHNQIWHAPYSGTRVRKERLWTRAVYYGRVR
jgi:cell wall-associated NlpC family hydrolase